MQRFPLAVIAPALALAVGCASAAVDEAEPGADANDTDAPASPGPDAVAPTPDATTPDPDATTPTPDATPPTPDATTPPPDAPPCTPVWTELLTNGNFDAGDTTWTSETTGSAIIQEQGNGLPLNTQSGTWAAWLAGYNNADELFWQSVNVPATATALRMRGYQCYVTGETGGAADTMTIEIRDGGGGPLETLASISNLDAGTVCNWSQFEYTVGSAYPGQTIRLAFNSHADGLYVTSFFVDSVSLEALACP